MIVACGEALVDLFPADAAGTTWRAVPGGSPVNVAVAVARLGAPAGFLGRLSTDRFGLLLAGHLQAAGVSERYVSLGGEPTALAVVEPGAADREPGFTFHGTGAADRMLRSTDAALGAEVTVAHFPGSVTLATEPGGAVLEATMVGAAGRMLVTLDPNVRPTIAGTPALFAGRLARWLRHVDLVKVSRADLAWLRPDADAEAVAGEWLGQGPAAVVVTRGGDGSIVLTASHRVEVAAVPVEVADTVGAGDSFMGGLLVWLHDHAATSAAALAGLDPDDWAAALRFAARVAAVTASRIGADPPTRIELDALVPPG